MNQPVTSAGLGKGTVFRGFGTRAGIFQALLDDDERDFRLIAYGRARTEFLIGHREIARGALDGRESVPAPPQTPMSRARIRFLLGELDLREAGLDVLATQLTAVLDGPVLTYLSAAVLTDAAPRVSERLGQGWEDLVRRVARSPRNRRRVPAGGKPEVQPG
jgi:AcrR family transcriptional regulator